MRSFSNGALPCTYAERAARERHSVEYHLIIGLDRFLAALLAGWLGAFSDVVVRFNGSVVLCKGNVCVDAAGRNIWLEVLLIDRRHKKHQTQDDGEERGGRSNVR